MKTERSEAYADQPFEALLLRLRPEMTRILKHQAIPPEDAEDLLQETFFALVFKWDSIRNPEAWLLSTLRNRCGSYWRRRHHDLFEPVDAKILDLLAGPQAPPQERTELRHDLEVALAQLPESERRVLHLRYGLGCESSEIAERLGFESGGMRSLTSRSIVHLGRELHKVGLNRHNTRG
jgi:RNA polymerase sigma-70 factor, ECF subfamily